MAVRVSLPVASGPDPRAAAAPRPARGTRLTTVWRRRLRPSRLLLSLLASLLFVDLARAGGAPVLPSGGSVKTGAGQIQTAGNQLTVVQASNQLGIDWRSFDIGADASVVFLQPSASAVALNRVVGNSASQIYGSLSANGQVFLVNPNGVLFAPGASVDVGGLIVSTLDLTQQDFAAGRYRFAGGGGALVNQGRLAAAPGGYVALFGGTVSNRGVVEVRTGSVLLASGAAVTVDIDNAGLIAATVTGGANKAIVDNGGLIDAAGGTVRLDARTAQGIAESLVNNSGVIRAQGIDAHDGQIFLTGATQIGNAGTLDASGAGAADGGAIVVKADMGQGTATIGGQLLAGAGPQGGAGGSIETSGAHVTVRGGTVVDTSAPRGRTGQWLIDPADYDIAPSGGDITGQQLANNLASTNVTILSSQGTVNTAGNGDLFVNDPVSWTSGNTLTLSALRNVNVNAGLSSSGGGSVVLRADNTGTGTGTVSFGTGAQITLNGTGTRSVDIYYNPTSYAAPTAYGAYVSGASAVNAWMLVDGVGQASGGTTGLQAIGTNPSGLYALGRDIDASATSGWNSGAGFTPIANFTGRLDGLGHAITGLTINLPNSYYVGLFGTLGSGAVVDNLSLAGAAVTGYEYVGTLAGQASGGSSIASVSASGSVTGGYAYYGYDMGGLVGYNGGSISYANAAVAVGTASLAYVSDAGGLAGYSTGSISNSSATGAVTAPNGQAIGGLVGYAGSASISNSFATGTVSATGGTSLGGLIGDNSGSTISNAYATGAVNGGSGANYVGGLIGYSYEYAAATITNSYSTGNVTGSASGYVAGLIGYNAGSITGVSNSHFDIDRVTLNGAAGGVTTGGIYDNEFQDWLSHGFALNIANYAASLPFDAGTGAYDIGTLQGLKDLLGFVDASGYKFALTASLDLSGLSGYAIPAFSAQRLDGGGNTLANLSVTQSNTTSTGLIGSLASGSTISNLNLSNVSVTGTSNVGGLVGYNAGGTITNDSVSGSVTGGGNYVGGLVGNSAGVIGGSSSSGSVSSTGSYVGGLVGYSNAAIGTSTSSATVSNKNGNYVGGLVGYTDGSGVINASSATGAVTNQGGYGGTGGLVGLASAAITASHASGNVSGTSGYYVGGLVGDNAAAISGSYATGSVAGGTSGNYVGGLVGYNSGTIAGSYSTGNVSGLAGGFVAGLVGYSVGGIGAITNAYFDIDRVTVNGAVGGVSIGGLYDTEFQDWIGHGLALNIASYTSSLPYDPGSGTYLIASPQGLKDLLGFATQPGYSFRLTAGVDLSSLPGYYIPYFAAAQLDGGGFTLANLSASQPASTANGYGLGLVGTLASGSTLKNLTLSNVAVSGGDYVGGLVGNSNGTITNVSVSGAVSGGSATGYYVGGVIGYAGGGNVSYAVDAGSVSGRGYVGGLAGYAGSGVGVSTSSSSASIAGASNYVGGLVGFSGATINASSASGAISLASGASDVGGLVGYNSGAISNSYATGAVTATTGAAGYLGGLVGDNAGSISTSYATGAVNSDGGSNVGGLVGFNSGTIAGSYASGNVSGATYVGGLVGNDSSSNGITNSHYDIDQVGVNGSPGWVTVGGLYDAQFRDWIGNGLALSSITSASYSSVLPFDSASGSYQVGSIQALKDLLGFAGQPYKFVLTANLDLSHLPGFDIPVFAATSLDGGGHTLSNFNGSQPNDYVGLIGRLGSGSTVENLNLANVAVSGGSYVGGLVGYNSGGTIGNVTVSGSVSGTGSYVGGLVGQSASGSIAAASTSGTVSAAAASSYVGGLVGDNGGTISNSNSTSNIAGGTSSVGGLVGANEHSASINASFASGAVTSGSNNYDAEYVGGLAGWNDGGISTSYASGAVNATGYYVYYAGGLVGFNYGTIASVYATGAVTATASYGYSTGIGGLLGYNSGGVSTAYASGHVSGIGAGGLIGTNAGSSTSSYWDVTTSGQSTSAGSEVGLTSTQAQTQASYSGWDFNATWWMASGSTRPFLRSEWSTTITNSHQLQLMAMNPAASYTLANNLDLGNDLAAVSGLYPGMWGANGFVPVGNGATNFSGALDGQSHYVAGLVVNQGTLSATPTGLFGIIGATGSVGNLGLNAATVTGGTLDTGLLAGTNNGTISNSYASGSVQGQANVGGLVGRNAGAITNAYATGSVQGGVGNASGTAVTSVGGLVGANSGTITDTYAAGTVPSTAGVVAGSGLVGQNSGTVTASYWDADSTPAGSVGSGLSGANLEQQASYPGWSFGSVWTLYNGNTQAFLTSFMTPLTVTADSVSMVYDRNVYAGTLAASYSNPAAAANLQGTLSLSSAEGGNVNVGSYAITPSGLWSNNQQGYAIAFVPGQLAITPAPLSVAGVTVESKTYDGTTNATITGNNPTLAGVLAGDSVTLSGTVSVGGFASKNVGTNIPVVIGGVSLSGPSAADYAFTGTATTTANIAPAPLTITAATDSKTYNGTTTSAATPTLSSGTVFAGDSLTGLAQAFASKNVMGTNGSTLAVTGYTLSDGNGGNNYAVTLANGTGTIAPAQLSVTGSQVYTGATYFAGVNLAVTGVAGETFLVAGHGTLATAGVQSSQNLGDVSTLALTPVGGALLSNYQTLSAANSSVNVTPATLNVTGTQVYNGGTAFAGANLVVAGVGGETFAASGSAGLASKNVQSNAALSSVSGLTLNPVGGDSLGNYLALTTADTRVSVTPAPLTLNSGTVADKTYDGTTQAAISGGTFSGIVAADIGSVNLTGYGTFASKNVGNGIAVTVGTNSLGGAAAMDYTLTSSSALSANITPATLTVTGSRTYNGSATFAGSGLAVAGVAGETFAASGSATLGTANVQSGVPLASVSGLTLNPVGGDLLSNYAPLATADTSVSVTKAQLRVAGTQVYNGATTVPAANLGATGVNGETFTVTGSGTLASKNVQSNQNLASLGTLALAPVNGDSLGNYQPLTTASTSVSVTPQTLTLLSGTAQNKVYDGGYVATLSGGTFSGLIAGDSVSLSGYGTFVSKNVGNGIGVTVGTNSLAGPEAADYLLQPSSALTANITPATLTLTGSQVYNGTTSYASANLSVAGVNGETFGAYGTAVLADKNVQTSRALASVAGLTLYGVNGSLLANYLPLAVGNTSVSVTPAALVVAGSQVYNGGLGFAAANLTVSGVNGESFTATGSASLSVKDVQSNAPLASVAGLTLAPVNGDSLGNYQPLAAANTSVSVTPAPLILTGGTAQNKVYDGSTQAAISGGTFSGLIAGDSVSLTGYGTFATKNVGNAILVAVNASDLTGPAAADYTLQASNILTANITPATLTATGSQLYNGTTNFAGAGLTISGVAGETFVATGNATLSGKDVQAGQNLASVAGLVLNPANGGLLSNYLPLATANTTVSVTPAPLVVTGTQVYNGGTAFAAANLAVAGVNGESFAVSGTGTLGVKDVQANQPLAGVAGLVLSPVNGDLLSDYQPLSTGNTRVSVTPKTVVVSNVGAQDKVYDGTATAYLVGGSYVGLIPGDAVSVTGTGSFASRNVGANIAVTVGAGSLTGPSAPDYLPVLQGSLAASITPATLVVTGTEVYNGTPRFVPGNLVVAGVNGETFTASGSAPLASRNVQAGQNLASVAGLVLSPVNGDLLGNYFPLTTANTTVSVTPATLVATGTQVYNAGSAFAAANLSVSGVNGETFAPSGKGTLSVKDVQTNAPLASVAGLTLSPVGGDLLSNYFPFGVAATAVTVTPAPLSLSGGAALNKVYDGTNVAGLSGGTISGVYAGDTVAWTGLGTFASKNVGNAIAVSFGSNSLSGPSAQDYVLTSSSGPMSANITPATLSATGSALYTGTTAFAGANLVVAGVNGETFAAGGAVTLGNKNVQTGQAAAAIDQLTLTPVNGDLLSNYFPLTASQTIVSVTPAPLVVTGTQVYNAQTAFAAANLSVSGVNGETFAVSGSGNLAVKDVQSNRKLGSVAGLALSPVNGDLLSNYLPLSVGNTSVSVTPASLTLSGGTVFDKVYDGTATAALGGGSLSGVYAGDTVSLTGVGTFASKNVGTNIAVTLTANSLGGAQAADYTLHSANALSASIAPATLVVSGTELYNGTSSFAGANLVVAGVNGETFAATGSAALATKNVQTKQPLASVAGLTLNPVDGDLLSNYLPLSTTNTNVSVTPAPLSITGTRVYDGTASFANAGLTAAGVNGETFVLGGDGVLTSKNVQTNQPLATVAGLTLTPVGGDSLSNYLPLTVADTSVSVTPRRLDGSIAAGSSVYGAALAPGALSFSGVLAGDQVFASASISTAGNTSLSGHLQAGSYPAAEIVGALSGADAGNYTATAITGAYTVTPLTLTVSGQTALNKVYDGTLVAPLSNASLNGVLAGDDVALAPSGTFASKNVGTGIAVTAVDALKGASAANYVVQQPVGFAAAITPAPLTLTASDASRYYGDPDPAFGFQLSGFVAGETPASAGVTGAATATSTATARSGVGLYAIVPGAGSLQAANYFVQTLVAGALTVTPRPLAVVADNVVRFAGDPNPSPFQYSTNVGGLVNGDALASVAIDVPAANGASAGGDVFALTPSAAVFGAGAAANYALTYDPGLLIVLVKPTLNSAQSSNASNSFFVVVDPQALQQTEAELARQSAILNAAPFPATPPAAGVAQAAPEALGAGTGTGEISVKALVARPLITLDAGLTSAPQRAPASGGSPANPGK